MLKHTPGPWRIAGNKVFGHITTEIADLGPSKEHMELDERIANARLIASAPKIYEGLKQAQIAIRAVVESFEKVDMINSVWQRALEEISAIIAEAEGR